VLCHLQYSGSHKLEGTNKGRLLTREDRAGYGLSDLKHGDMIFMLSEGKMFCPSFSGKKFARL
jgi:hypothetical protein